MPPYDAEATRRRLLDAGYREFARYARGQIDAIARAQKNGELPAHLHPGFVLGYVLHLATGWVSVSPEYEAAIDVPDPEDRARQVENAVRALLTAPAPASA